jgi:hypothetical protein
MIYGSSFLPLHPQENQTRGLSQHLFFQPGNEHLSTSPLPFFFWYGRSRCGLPLALIRKMGNRAILFPWCRTMI